ncbi:MAG: RNA polymerase sigma factor [Butyricimonas faecihominis]
MNEISDEDIVRMFHSGNGEEKAFRLLVGKYSERLYWHIRKIVIGHEDSDDVLQNTFIKIWKGLREFGYEAKLFTWMYRVATNEAINFLSKSVGRLMGTRRRLLPCWKINWKVIVFFVGIRSSGNCRKPC